jgi:hypothetical protein
MKRSTKLAKYRTQEAENGSVHFRAEICDKKTGKIADAEKCVPNPRFRHTKFTGF